MAMEYWNCEPMGIEDLIGKVLKRIKVSVDGDEIFFECFDGDKFLMYHEQDCCESVYLDDVCGSWHDFLDTEILDAYIESNEEEAVPDGYGEHVTWTFYNLRTIKGSITLTWRGESNGYYSEEVNFIKL